MMISVCLAGFFLLFSHQIKKCMREEDCDVPN